MFDIEAFYDDLLQRAEEAIPARRVIDAPSGQRMEMTVNGDAVKVLQLAVIAKLANGEMMLTDIAGLQMRVVTDMGIASSAYALDRLGLSIKQDRDLRSDSHDQMMRVQVLSLLKVVLEGIWQRIQIALLDLPEDDA